MAKVLSVFSLQMLGLSPLESTAVSIKASGSYDLTVNLDFGLDTYGNPIKEKITRVPYHYRSIFHRFGLLGQSNRDRRFFRTSDLVSRWNFPRRTALPSKTCGARYFISDTNSLGTVGSPFPQSESLPGSDDDDAFLLRLDSESEDHDSETRELRPEFSFTLTESSDFYINPNDYHRGVVDLKFRSEPQLPDAYYYLRNLSLQSKSTLSSLINSYHQYCDSYMNNNIHEAPAAFPGEQVSRPAAFVKDVCTCLEDPPEPAWLKPKAQPTVPQPKAKSNATTAFTTSGRRREWPNDVFKVRSLSKEDIEEIMQEEGYPEKEFLGDFTTEQLKWLEKLITGKGRNSAELRDDIQRIIADRGYQQSRLTRTRTPQQARPTTNLVGGIGLGSGLGDLGFCLSMP